MTHIAKVGIFVISRVVISAGIAVGFLALIIWFGAIVQAIPDTGALRTHTITCTDGQWYHIQRTLDSLNIKN